MEATQNGHVRQRLALLWCEVDEVTPARCINHTLSKLTFQDRLRIPCQRLYAGREVSARRFGYLSNPGERAVPREVKGVCAQKPGLAGTNVQTQLGCVITRTGSHRKQRSTRLLGRVHAR